MLSDFQQRATKGTNHFDVNFIIEDNENFMDGVLIVGGWMEEHKYTVCLEAALAIGRYFIMLICYEPCGVLLTCNYSMIVNCN